MEAIEFADPVLLLIADISTRSTGMPDVRMRFGTKIQSTGGRTIGKNICLPRPGSGICSPGVLRIRPMTRPMDAIEP